jgi:methionyl-tRNA formyltransferase
LLVECLEPWARGQLLAAPQDEALATYCRRLERSDAELDWSRPAEELARVVRAHRGRTDAFTFWNDKLFKVLSAEPTAAPATPIQRGSVGVVQSVVGGPLPSVATGQGALQLLEVALEGRAPTSGAAFLNGYPALIGATLGRSADEGARERR